MRWASWKKLKEQVSYIACPEKHAEEIRPKCLPVQRTSKHELTDKITCLGRVDTVFSHPAYMTCSSQTKYTLFSYI